MSSEKQLSEKELQQRHNMAEGVAEYERTRPEREARQAKERAARIRTLTPEVIADLAERTATRLAEIELSIDLLCIHLGVTIEGMKTERDWALFVAEAIRVASEKLDGKD